MQLRRHPAITEDKKANAQYALTSHRIARGLERNKSMHHRQKLSEYPEKYMALMIDSNESKDNLFVALLLCSMRC
jgi:hypothetical protein